MPALPFAEMNYNANVIGTNGLDEDQFGQVAYKLSLLSASGSLPNGAGGNGQDHPRDNNNENAHPIVPGLGPGNFGGQMPGGGGPGGGGGNQPPNQPPNGQPPQPPFGGGPPGPNGNGNMQPQQIQFEPERNNRRSVNTTECVNVPSSEHVAEIVGRQGCKIKALRAKTNTYIKTPVRGEEPVFVVTGRKEDVQAAKKEIQAAAEHFTQIRASRRGSNAGYPNGSPNGGPPSPQGGPGNVTLRVPVPYKVVGLVVGPKGATIKRIQQQTHTYIVTPSRDKDPVFEITGTPANVQAARREIEQHIASRTGLQDTTNLPNHTSPVQSLFPSPNDRYRQNGHSDQNGFGRYGDGGAFDVPTPRRNGHSLTDDFHSNGNDVVFNNISGNINGVGSSGGDLLGFQGNNFLFGGSTGASNGHFHSNGTSSSQFGFGASNGFNESSAFSFSTQDQYLNGFLQQNSQLLAGYETAGDMPNAGSYPASGWSEDFKLDLDSRWARAGLAFGNAENVSPPCLRRRRSAGSGHCMACGGVDGHLGACSMDRSPAGDVRSAPATARFSPNGLDYVNGTGTPNGGASSPLNMLNGFSSAAHMDFDLSEQQHQSVRRIRSDPLASGLQMALGGFTTSSSPVSLAYPSAVTTTAASSTVSSGQDRPPSPPPIELVGLSLQDELLGTGLTNGHDSDAHNEQKTGKCLRCQEHKDLACLVPCGHMNFCKECADKLTSKKTEEKAVCPTCDQPFSLGVLPRKG